MNLSGKTRFAGVIALAAVACSLVSGTALRCNERSIDILSDHFELWHKVTPRLFVSENSVAIARDDRRGCVLYAGIAVYELAINNVLELKSELERGNSNNRVSLDKRAAIAGFITNVAAFREAVNSPSAGNGMSTDLYFGNLQNLLGKLRATHYFLAE